MPNTKDVIVDDEIEYERKKTKVCSCMRCDFHKEFFGCQRPEGIEWDCQEWNPELNNYQNYIFKTISK